MAQGTVQADYGLKYSQNDPTRQLHKPHLPMEPLEAAARSFQNYRVDAGGSDPAVKNWSQSFPGRPEHARLFQELYAYDPDAANRLALAMTTMPEAGTELFGFQLLAELGRGAFARVFLAEQENLARRRVVLKVAADFWGEIDTLAQLHHPNIVPVYSFHHHEPFQAVCMPFQGTTTLDDVLHEIQGKEALPTSGKALVQIFNKGPLNLTEATEEHCLARLLANLSYVEAITWIGADLAAGLAHAHGHGIIHRDLKPANVLLTDEGRPMLLDFNAAADIKPGATMAAWAAGTLPYMAPEQLAAFQGNKAAVDARCDIYAFGMVLFELLTGRYPFHYRDLTVDRLVDSVLEDRRVSPPRLRIWNPAVSPALERIVRRCLEPDPARRYQTSRQLQEDLDCQRQHRPLRHTGEPLGKERLHKWVRRHPRWTVAGAAALVVLLALAAVGISWSVRSRQLDELRQQQAERAKLRQERAQARDAWQQFQEDFKHALFLLYTQTEPNQLARGIQLGSRLLDGYEVPENPHWQQGALVLPLAAGEKEQLGDAMAELLLLMARPMLAQKDVGKDSLDKALLMNGRAAESSEAAVSSPGLWRQRETIYALLGRPERAKECRARADALPWRTAQDYYWRGSELLVAGRPREALPLLQQATHKEPQNFWAWFVLANGYERLAMDGRAESCYGACIALWPRFHWAHFNRALAFLRQQEYRLACADFDTVIQLRPDLTDAYLNRALARQGLRQFQEAEQDLTEALKRGDTSTRLYFLRARVRGQRGDKVGASSDYQEGLRRTPVDEVSWLARGFAHLSRDPQAALADFDQALRLNPRSFAGLQNKAHVLAEKLDRTKEAVQVLNQAVELYPDATLARAGRGVVLARLGQRDQAIQDAQETLLRDTSPPRLYQVACIYALTSAKHPEDRPQAFQLLSSALRKGYGFDLMERDEDLNPIRGLPEFRRLVEAARALTPKKVSGTFFGPNGQ
jgi:serine/threonine protein kinase/tetratricopeptide (TPR) repeat protein